MNSKKPISTVSKTALTKQTGLARPQTATVEKRPASSAKKAEVVQQSQTFKQQPIEQKKLLNKEPVKQEVTQVKRDSTQSEQSQAPKLSAFIEDHEDNKTKSKSIKVFCRFRPLNKAEQELSNQNLGKICVKIPNSQTVVVTDNTENTFNFDEIFPNDTEQSFIFEQISRRSLNDVLKGFNATLFCYGQTGSGKTFTMYGLDVKKELELGIIPRSITYIFDQISNHPDPEVEFEIQYSMLEIYKEQLLDLLNHTRENLQIKEHPKKGIYVDQLQQICVGSYQESMDLLEMGQDNKTVASTRMNSQSSRAHTIFIVTIKQKAGDGTERTGVLNLIDLAGSEKISRTGAEGETLEQAKKINLSLTNLGLVINALTTNKDHIPYRDSKLTRLLQESLGGNYKTSLIVNCSLHSSSAEETIGTLRFGTRAKSIKTNFKINLVLSPEKMQKIIDELKAQLILKDKIIESKGFISSDVLQDDINQKLEVYKKKEQETNQKLQEIQKYNEELEVQNSKLEEKVKNIDENGAGSSNSSMQDLIKKIAHLTDEKEKISFKYNTLQQKYDLLDKQQEFYQSQIQQLKSQLQLTEIRELNCQQEKQNILNSKINEYLQNNFQDYYQKNFRKSIIQQFRDNPEIDAKNYFDLTVINVANSINYLYENSQDNQKLIQFLLKQQQYQQCMITENVDFLLKIQEQTYKLELEKFRLRGDYILIQENLISEMETMIEKANGSLQLIKKKVEKQELDIFKMQTQQTNQIGNQEAQGSTHLGAQIKRRITKANCGVLDMLRRTSNAAMQPLQSNLAQKVNSDQNQFSTEAQNLEAQRQQNKILVLLTELDLERTKTLKVKETYEQFSQQVKNYDLLIQSYSTFELNKQTTPLIKQQFQDLQNIYEIFYNWMNQFFQMLKLKGIETNQELKDLKFFLQENSSLCDQTIVDFLRMQKNAMEVAKVS